MSDIADTFRDQVSRNAEGTPYVVTATDRGFDVGIDIVDAQWFELYRKVGLERTFVHHVAVDGSTYTVTDDSRTLEWEAGHPRLGATLERFVGRRYEFSFQKTIAVTGETQPTIRIVEDLPAPLGPRNPKASPRRTSTSMPSTATKSPNRSSSGPTG